MADPLALSYHWQPPVLYTSIGAVTCIGLVARSEASGRGPVLAIVVVLWALCLGVVWARTRAYLQVDGSRLTVRHLGRFHTFEGDQVVAVQQFLTGHGPCYRLRVEESDGQLRRYVAPVALLRSGHSTLFDWILTRAPKAELDRGSQRTLDQLRVRGLVT